MAALKQLALELGLKEHFDLEDMVNKAKKAEEQLEKKTEEKKASYQSSLQNIENMSKEIRKIDKFVATLSSRITAYETELEGLCTERDEANTALEELRANYKTAMEDHFAKFRYRIGNDNASDDFEGLDDGLMLDIDDTEQDEIRRLRQQLDVKDKQLRAALEGKGERRKAEGEGPSRELERREHNEREREAYEKALQEHRRQQEQNGDDMVARINSNIHRTLGVTNPNPIVQCQRLLCGTYQPSYAPQPPPAPATPTQAAGASEQAEQDAAEAHSRAEAAAAEASKVAESTMSVG